eukprot:gene9149-49705_t
MLHRTSAAALSPTSTFGMPSVVPPTFAPQPAIGLPPPLLPSGTACDQRTVEANRWLCCEVANSVRALCAQTGAFVVARPVDGRIDIYGPPRSAAVAEACIEAMREGARAREQ